MKKLILIFAAIFSCLILPAFSHQAMAFTDVSADDFSEFSKICDRNYSCSCAFPNLLNDLSVEPAPLTATECLATCKRTASPDTDQAANAYHFKCDNADGITLPTDGPIEAVITSTQDEKIKDPLFPKLNVEIPGLGYEIVNGVPNWKAAEVTIVGGTQHTNLIGTYVNAMYTYLLGAASLIAITMLMIAGLQYATARGDSKQVDNAKKRINNAVVGIILLLLAFNIAFIIDPATVSFESLSLQSIKGIQIHNETPASFSEEFISTTEEGDISVPLYDQRDYVDFAYGPEKCKTAESGNINSSGCGVTSFAMAVAALTQQTIAVPDVATSFYINGYRPMNKNTGCGENGTYNNAMYESDIIAANNLRARQIPIGNTDELKDLVKQGRLIITSYKTSSGGGHYVLISGYSDDGHLIVNNPWGGTRELRTEDWWFSTIKSAAYIDTVDNFIEAD